MDINIEKSHGEYHAFSNVIKTQSILWIYYKRYICILLHVYRTMKYIVGSRIKYFIS